MQLNTKTKAPQIIQFKSGKGPEQTFFQRRDRDGQQTCEKNAQHHQSSGKCKSKPQQGMILYLSEWLISKRQEKMSVGKNVEKKEPLCTVGGDANWHSYCGEQYEVPSKNLKENYHKIQ